MTDTTILIQKNSNGKVKHIILTLDGDTLHREWGIVGGKLQKTSNTYGFINPGKSNELDPEASARAAYERVISTKTKEGYQETVDLNDLSAFDKNQKTDQDIDLDNLPTEFCCSKPTASISDQDLDALIFSKNSRFFLKYNGSCHYIMIGLSGEVKIYTRRMDDHTVKYPEIIKEVKDRCFSPGTLFITEFCIDPELNLPHMEAFKLMSSISKSNVHNGKPKTDLAKNFARQDVNNGGHRVRACVFGVLYYGGEKTWDYPMNDIQQILSREIHEIEIKDCLFYPEEILIGSSKVAREFVKAYKTQHEGLVAWDMSKSMEVTMNGKPKRRAAFKIKPRSEMDVIAYGWNEGTGDLQGKIGSLKICKLDNSGKLVDIGSVGSGLKPLRGDCDVHKWTFPCVIEVEYDQVFAKTGALQFPSFSKVHEDKQLSDIETFEEHLKGAA